MRYDVAATTVLRALAVLREEGLIQTRGGVGFWIRPRPNQTLVTLVRSDRLSARMPTPNESTQLDMPRGVPVLEVRHADGTVEVFPADRFAAQLEPQAAHGS
ncbi:hypothetical protein [Dactylosporangium sp. NPDC051541]|uniref:hypothetical protein n=1 Tax=Dactylosporangium sp. NPDC051541 TaxID=3363977 RepID=UPI0037A385B9